MTGKSHGRLIVFEGSDGSGKETQSKLFLRYLRAQKIPSVYISFPRYEQSLWGAMVKRYLAGDFGKVREVDPYLASLAYAGDRASAAPAIRKWLNEGKVVVCNRYVGSNMAHMGGKVKSQKSKVKIINWIEELEYKENKIPREDVVIFLSVPVEVSRQLIRNRQLDIHESDLAYLGQVIKVYEELARTRKNWVKVECCRDDKILPPAQIHRKVLALAGKHLGWWPGIAGKHL